MIAKYCEAIVVMNGFKHRFYSLNNEVKNNFTHRETLSLEEYSSNLSTQTRALVTTPLVAKYKIRDELASRRFEDMERVVMNGGNITPTTTSPNEEPKLNESYLRTIFSPFSFSLSKILFSPKSSGTILESPISNTKSPSRNASSTIDLVSPMPMISYSPNRELSQRQHKLKQIIAEIIESEESYIISLKIVRNYYIEPLFIKQHFAIPLPIEAMYECLDKLILVHTKLLNLIIRQQFVQSTDELASIIGELVSDSIVPYYYEEYLKIHNCTSKVIKDNELFSSKSKNRWTNGWRNYLEATQPDTKKMDLSFLSLVQRPITRVAKYRLLLESLLKFSIGDNKDNLLKSLEFLKDKLLIMNRKSITLEEDWLHIKINKLLNFSNINKNYQFSSQFFGRPLLIGSISCIYITQSSRPKLITYGAILYKSHLILTDINLRKKKLDIFIIVDLSKSLILPDYKDYEGGIYSTNANSCKIIFEYEIYQFEILMTFLNQQEYEIWLIQLTLLIDIVNGPYPMDYSRRKENLLMIFPRDIGYYDICIKDQTNIIDSINNCYFKNLICIDNYFKYSTDLFMNINKYNRVKIETIFISIWSFQFPKLSSIETMKKKTPRKFKVDKKIINDTKSKSDSVKFHSIKGFFSYYLK